MSKSAPPSHVPPHHAPALLQEAIHALRAGLSRKAERLAAPLVRADPKNLVAAQVMGEALLLQGRGPEAVAVLEPAAQQSNDAATETLLAMALTASGRSSDALAQLRLAILRRPPFPLAFLHLSERLSEQGAIEDAVAILEQGLSLTPEVDALRLSLGRLFLQRNERAKARATFIEALTRAPESPAALTAMARSVALDGENPAAAELYRKALALRPDDQSARIGLAKCLLEMGLRDEGEALLRSAAAANPDLAATALTALSGATHGRVFLKPSAAAKFMGVERF